MFQGNWPWSCASNATVSFSSPEQKWYPIFPSALGINSCPTCKGTGRSAYNAGVFCDFFFVSYNLVMCWLGSAWKPRLRRLRLEKLQAWAWVANIDSTGALTSGMSEFHCLTPSTFWHGIFATGVLASILYLFGITLTIITAGVLNIDIEMKKRKLAHRMSFCDIKISTLDLENHKFLESQCPALQRDTWGWTFEHWDWVAIIYLIEHLKINRTNEIKKIRILII